MPVQKHLLPRQFFQPSCPSGGSFYACTTGTNFVGCCTSTSACASGCSDGSLEPASFNPSYYGQFQDQECPTGSRWYTCSATTPPFMGCCKSNPCSQDGCPVGDVTAGFLSSNPKVAADFAGANGFSAAASSSVASATSSATSSSSSLSATRSTISIPSSSSSSSSQSTSSSTSPTPTPLSTLPTPSPSPTPIGTIVGAAIGGAAFLLLLIAVILFFCRRRKTHDGAPSRLSWDFKPDTATTDVQPTPMYATQPKNDQALPSPQTPAPQYAPQPTTPTPTYASSSPHPPSSPAPQYSPPPRPELEMDAQQLAYPGPHEMGADTGLTGQGRGGGWSGRGTGLGLGFGGSRG